MADAPRTSHSGRTGLSAETMPTEIGDQARGEPGAPGPDTGSAREDSLQKRYVYKLSTNIVGAGVALAVQAIVLRVLGPISYGNFSFLNAFFNQVVGFFDTGVLLGFYSKLSQRPHETGLIRFYWGFAALASLLLLALIGAAFMLGLHQPLWPGQQAGFIWLAAVLGLLTWYNQAIGSIVDAYGLTVRGEIAQIQQRLLGLGLILLLLWLGWLDLTGFFWYSYAMLAFVGVSWWQILHRHGIAVKDFCLLPAF